MLGNSERIQSNRENTNKTFSLVYQPGVGAITSQKSLAIMFQTKTGQTTHRRVYVISKELLNYTQTWIANLNTHMKLIKSEFSFSIPLLLRDNKHHNADIR